MSDKKNDKKATEPKARRKRGEYSTNPKDENYLLPGKRPTKASAKGETLNMPAWDEIDFETVPGLARFKFDGDLRQLLETQSMSKHQVRTLVDNFYLMQGYRIRTASQEARMEKVNERSEFVGWVRNAMRYVEDQMEQALKVFAYNHPVCKWAMATKGIAHVLSAGLLAHIPMDLKTKYAGQTFRLAGVVPGDRWFGREGARQLVAKYAEKRKPIVDSGDTVERLAKEINRTPEWVRSKLFVDKEGKKMTRDAQSKFLARRPWNAEFKTLVWKIGESFVKVSSAPDAYYGQEYRNRKDYEIRKNNSGEYWDRAQERLALCKDKRHAQADIYEDGRIPDGQLDNSAKRVAAKRFLGHFWEVYYWWTFDDAPPIPWVHEHGGHSDYTPPPNLHLAPWVKRPGGRPTKPLSERKIVRQ